MVCKIRDYLTKIKGLKAPSIALDKRDIGMNIPWRTYVVRTY